MLIYDDGTFDRYSAAISTKIAQFETTENEPAARDIVPVPCVYSGEILAAEEGSGPWRRGESGGTCFVDRARANRTWRRSSPARYDRSAGWLRVCWAREMPEAVAKAQDTRRGLPTAPSVARCLTTRPTPGRRLRTRSNQGQSRAGCRLVLPPGGGQHPGDVMSKTVVRPFWAG